MKGPHYYISDSQSGPSGALSVGSSSFPYNQKDLYSLEKAVGLP